ncbi:MAG: molybdopterin-dependent oxidoreductase [Dehalococcoidia bacterium]|nr:molybdopterin-dependent oxidoreductase [Dehalococcoidia bacterium]
MTAYRVVGTALPRYFGEGADKVTGQAKYTADIALPGTLRGKLLHSPYAHARIVRIDTAAARALPGVHAVITGADTGQNFYGRGVRDVPLLARERVRYAGERVAAVAADDEDIAKQALDLIEVEYEELPAVFGVEEALTAEAPLLHPDFNSYRGVRPGPAQPGVRGVFEQEAASNAYGHQVIERGDLEKGFAEADLVIENTYVTQRVHQAYLEPHTVLIHVDGDDVHAWGSSKAPFGMRDSLAAAVGLEPERIVVHPTLVGGDFGGKGAPLDAPVCYLLAKATGCPVLMELDYLEEFMSGNPRHATLTRLKTGVKQDGALTAHSVEYLVNCGAYAGYKPGGMIGGANQAAGIYKVPNCRIETAHVYTNTVPGGYMRGPGEPQGIFAIESHMDEIAHRLGIDPLELRLRNLIEDGDEMPAGERLQDVKARETLQASVDASGYGATKALRVGRGIAMGERPPGGGEGNAAVTFQPDGRIILGTPIYDQGVGTYTVLRQIVAEELQVSPERITLEIWDTTAVASDSGLAGSRGTHLQTTVSTQAAREAIKALLAHAAETLGCPEDVLSFRGEEIRRGDIEESMPWPDLLTRSGKSISGQGHYTSQGRSHVTSFTAQIAEVSVDEETGAVKLLRFTTAHDVGQVINPMSHQGQINGGVMQGIGYALMEELRVEDGRVTSLSFGDYKIPTIRDIPELQTALIESQSGVGPYQIKGIGETPLGPVAAAIANAVEDAVGVRIRDLPITAEKVYAALKTQKQG